MIAEGEKHKLELPEKTVFGLVRHATTFWNEEKRIQGSKNSNLSEKGKRNASQWPQTLKQYEWQRIIASNLGRVHETVAILNESLNLPVTFDDSLNEINWGRWEGLKIRDINTAHQNELEQQINKGWNFRAPEGESRIEALQRAEKALLQAASLWPQQKILVVCHQGIIKCILYKILERAFLPHEPQIIKTNCIQLISCKNHRLSCEQLNITLDIPS